MSVVSPIAGSRAAQLSPQDEFTHARGVMLRAYVAWLRTRPESGAVLEEIIGTHSTMDQLRHLALGPLTWSCVPVIPTTICRRDAAGAGGAGNACRPPNQDRSGASNHG